MSWVNGATMDATFKAVLEDIMQLFAGAVVTALFGYTTHLSSKEDTLFWPQNKKVVSL